MPIPRRQRRSRQQKKKGRNWRQIAFYVLSALVAVSMAIGYVIAYITPR